MIEIDKFINCIINYGKIQNFIISNKNNNIDNLRKFHNYIKSILIINNSKNAKSLLDVACGRGGDLQKWLNDKLHLNYILAFDSHKESIYSSTAKGDSFDGAIARFKNIKKKYKHKMPFINFQVLNLLQQNTLSKINNIDSNKLYDVVSCQFALHYFCENDEILNNTLLIISKKLKQNGLFIGTATDGDKIHNILQNGNVNIPLLTLIKQYKTNYLFYIKSEQQKTSKINKTDKTDKTVKIDKTDNRQNYFEIQGASSEFYLFKEKLKYFAKLNNLELIEYKTFYEWYQEIKESKIEKNIYDLSIYEMVISFLNFSFIFKKLSN